MKKQQATPLATSQSCDQAIQAKIKAREYQRKWRLLRAEKEYESRRRWSETHKEKVKEIKRNWLEKNQDKRKQSTAAYRAKNVEAIREYNRLYMARKRATNPESEKFKEKSWRKSNLQYRIRKALRGRIQSAIQRGLLKTKQAPTMDLVGCSAPELIVWLEAQFKPGMSWDNWSLKGWHIDHIRPLASFPDLSDLEQQKQAFHYTNLQPLWAAENQSKSCKYNPKQPDPHG